jgi:hypothetical protein
MIGKVGTGFPRDKRESVCAQIMLKKRGEHHDAIQLDHIMI